MAHLFSKKQKQTATSSGRQHLPRSVLCALKSALFCSGGNKNDTVRSHSKKKRKAKESPDKPQQQRGGGTGKSLPMEYLPIDNHLQPIDIESEDEFETIDQGDAKPQAQQKSDGTEPSSSATASQRRTPPPFKPEKKMSFLKKALRKGKVSDCNSSSSTMDTKESTKEQAKKKQKKQPKKRQNLMAWLSMKMGSAGKVGTSLDEEKAKVSDLHKRMSELEQKKSNKQQQIANLKKLEGKDAKPQVKMVAKSLRAKKRQLSKLKKEVEAAENKIKQLTREHSPAIKERSQANSNNRAVSDTNTAIASGSQGPSVSTATAGNNVISVEPLSTQSVRLLPPRPSTTVRKFFLPLPDSTTVTPPKQVMREILSEDESTDEYAYERPRAAHPFRVRSMIENVQEFLPYELEYYNSDSDEEEPVNMVQDIRMEGMRKFEQQHSTPTKISTERKWRVRWTTVVDTDSEDDDFEFTQLEMTFGEDTPTGTPTATDQ